MVMGYIIAGMIIGPYTPPFALVSSIETINLLAELGIIMLLFVVGTEFPIAKLRSIGRKALVIAMSEAFGTFRPADFVGQAMGLALFDSLFLALSISVTSTSDRDASARRAGMLRHEASFLLLGVAIIEDIIIVSMLAVLQSVATTGHLSLEEIALSVGVVLAFIGAVLFVGSKTIPRLVDYMGRTNQYRPDPDNSAGCCIWPVVHCIFNRHICCSGAFFAGVLVAESKTQSIAKIITTPLKDMFAACFLSQ